MDDSLYCNHVCILYSVLYCVVLYLGLKCVTSVAKI